ncbi:AMP-binding protein [Ruminiclostridium cellulolyticum]|uniref:AMP-dependent synthetase and ligase n=1 Tax=Ruminiclostridium cellulolyticum (strain ATCC 35319 / DSM 5812 / JCM 6584 / H10) TaxID=394503 RepID=B8I2I5_RUMCH|nr:AMP-binding protein [Ruminiclostridium cellulolyticum]ACL75978.1 AMP-dependent synthetase and ligase [Ruminiclostridium cellulolyticum H10]
MLKNDIKSFYQLFNYIKDNNDNYINYLSWSGKKYKYFRKTFSEIHDDIQACYNNLKQAGITENSVIYIDIDNSYEFLICDFAIILTGALSIVSNNTEPLDKVKDRVRQFKAEYIISKRELIDSLVDVNVIDISSLFQIGNNSIVTQTLYNNKDFSVVFSSGTSGFPKALGITEQGSIGSSKHFFNYMGFCSSDKFMIYLPLANYQQRFFFWGCLITSVNIALGDDKSLFHALKEFNPTILLAPPNFYYNLFCSDNNNGFFKKIFKNINNKFICKHITHKPIYEALGKKMHYLLTGMAPIDLKVLEHFSDIKLEIYQIYGQTEIGMIACNNKKLNKIGTVGRPIIKLYLSDDNEIVTESVFPIVSCYYREDNTKDFLGMVRPTGDVGSIDNDGFLSINGRKNETIILNNGIKINPIMIENKIKSSLQIADMVIFKTRQESNNFALNIVLLIDGFSNLNSEAIKQNINSVQEIKSNTNIVNIYKYDLKIEEKKVFYTENGKFSRVRAIDFFKENFEKLVKI